MAEKIHDSKGLPFNPIKQDAVLGHMITDPKFFLQVKGIVQPDWFSDPHTQLVYKAMLAFYEKYQRPASADELRHSSEIQYAEPSMRVKLADRVGRSIRETENFKLDSIQNDLSMWLKARSFFIGVHTANKDFNNEKYAEAYAAMEKTLREIREASIVGDKEESFADWRRDLEDADLEKQNALTFGLKSVDRLLLPDSKGGSLLRGDTTVLLAPTNIGKTFSMITIAIANVKKGKRVLFITHEGRAEDIKEKILKCYLGVVDLKALATTDDGVKLIEGAILRLSNLLTYVSFNKAGLNIEEVEPFIRRKQEERMARNDGQGYDLVIDDYPGCLMTIMAKGGNFSRRSIDEIVYNYFVQLALEYNFHSLVAIQANREGAKVNKRLRGEDRLLTMEDVHESYGPMQKATNVITLNRDPLAKARKRMILHIDKSRSNETGFAVVARTDLARATAFSDSLGSVWYRGTATASDRVEDFLNNPDSNGLEIDLAEVVGDNE